MDIVITVMITESSFPLVKVAFLAVEQPRLRHLVHPVLQSSSIQSVEMCVLYPAALPPQWQR